MYIKREIDIAITDEEREILQKAQLILMGFEYEATVSDEETLQAMYEQNMDGYEHDFALSTAIDLLDTILNGIEDTED